MKWTWKYLSEHHLEMSHLRLFFLNPEAVLFFKFQGFFFCNLKLCACIKFVCIKVPLLNRFMSILSSEWDQRMFTK